MTVNGSNVSKTLRLMAQELVKIDVDTQTDLIAFNF